MCNEDRAADLDHRFFVAVASFAQEKRKFNWNANIPPCYAVQDEFRAKADEFRAKDRDLNKKLSMWAGDYERGGRCGGHTPVFRWRIFALLSLWKVSVGIELTNGDWGRVSLSLHCGPDKEGEAGGKQRERDKNTQGVVLVTVQNINIFS